VAASAEVASAEVELREDGDSSDTIFNWRFAVDINSSWQLKLFLAHKDRNRHPGKIKMLP